MLSRSFRRNLFYISFFILIGMFSKSPLNATSLDFCKINDVFRMSNWDKIEILFDKFKDDLLNQMPITLEKDWRNLMHEIPHSTKMDSKSEDQNIKTWFKIIKKKILKAKKNSANLNHSKKQLNLYKLLDSLLKNKQKVSPLHLRKAIQIVFLCYSNLNSDFQRNLRNSANTPHNGPYKILTVRA